MRKVENYNTKGEKVDPSKLIIRDIAIYDIINKYISQANPKE